MLCPSIEKKKIEKLCAMYWITNFLMDWNLNFVEKAKYFLIFDLAKCFRQSAFSTNQDCPGK